MLITFVSWANYFLVFICVHCVLLLLYGTVFQQTYTLRPLFADFRRESKDIFV